MNLRQSDLSYVCIIKESDKLLNDIASLKRNCLRSVNFSISSVDSQTTYEVISFVFTVLFTESSADIFILKRKWRWVKKVIYFDCTHYGRQKRQAHIPSVWFKPRQGGFLSITDD